MMLGGRMLRQLVRVSLLLFAAGLCCGPAWAQTAAAQRMVDWPIYGGNLASQHYSSLDQINARNVKDLKIVWRWYGGNFGPNPELKRYGYVSIHVLS